VKYYLLCGTRPQTRIEDLVIEIDCFRSGGRSSAGFDGKESGSSRRGRTQLCAVDNHKIYASVEVLSKLLAIFHRGMRTRVADTSKAPIFCATVGIVLDESLKLHGHGGEVTSPNFISGGAL
jgi:hypothetical protein